MSASDEYPEDYEPRDASQHDTDEQAREDANPFISRQFDPSWPGRVVSNTDPTAHTRGQTGRIGLAERGLNLDRVPVWGIEGDHRVKAWRSVGVLVLIDTDYLCLDSPSSRIESVLLPRGSEVGQREPSEHDSPEPHKDIIPAHARTLRRCTREAKLGPDLHARPMRHGPVPPIQRHPGRSYGPSSPPAARRRLHDAPAVALTWFSGPSRPPVNDLQRVTLGLARSCLALCFMCCAAPGPCREVRMVAVGRSEVTQVVARPAVAGVTGQDAPLSLDLAQDAGRVVQSHVQSNRGVETGEVNLTEVDRVSVGRPLTASVTIAASGQVGFLIQPRLDEPHQCFSHRGKRSCVSGLSLRLFRKVGDASTA